MGDLQSDYDETHEVLAKANQRIAELEEEIIDRTSELEAACIVKDIDIKNLREEIERLRKTGQHCGCISSEDGESIVESCMFHANQLAEMERLKLALKSSRASLEDENKELRAEIERLRYLLGTYQAAEVNDPRTWPLVQEQKAENERLKTVARSRKEKMEIYSIEAGELEAENERFAIEASKLRSANHTLEDIRELHTAEIERLRKELASYRKGECRRKIDKAMEGE